MAVAEVKTRIQNTGRRASARRLTDAQIPHFGSKRQKAALATRKAAKRNKTARRNRAGSKSQRTGSTSHRARRNVGEVLIATLAPALAGNPAGKGKAMATKSKSKKKGHPHHAGSKPRRRNRGMSAKSGHAHRPRRRPRRQNRRRNAGSGGGGGGIANLVYSSVFVIVGAVGTKLLTQAVLQTNNTGVWGYLGNAAATFLLSFVAHKFMRNPAAARSIATGGVAQIVLRIMNDYTPLGQFASQSGLGDYQASNFVTPQRYVDALHSAQVEIPSGWAPQIMAAPQVAAAARAGAGVGSLYEGGGAGSLY